LITYLTGIVLPIRGDPPAFEGSRRGYQPITLKKTTCYEMLHRISELAGSCEHDNGPTGSITGGEYLD